MGDIALRFVVALWKFWRMHSHQSEGHMAMEAALAESSDLESPTRSRALYGAGWIAHDQGDYAGARAFFEQSLALARKVGTPRAIAEALHGVGAKSMTCGSATALPSSLSAGRKRRLRSRLADTGKSSRPSAQETRAPLRRRFDVTSPPRERFSRQSPCRRRWVSTATPQEPSTSSRSPPAEIDGSRGRG